MDPRKLEIFLKLLDTRSFSKTASLLGLSQPSISASLKSLEDFLGQKLFERTPRSVKPLPAAEILSPFAQDIVDTAAQAAWAVGHQLSGIKEKLAIGASSVPAAVYMPSAIVAFNKQYPDIMVRLKCGQSRDVARSVADGELDAALVGAPPEHKELTRTMFSRDRLVLIASESLAEAIGCEPKSPEDLLNWPLIMREEGSGTRTAFLASVGRQAGKLSGRMQVRAEVDGLAPALALARMSLGATVASSLLLPQIDLAGLMAMKLDFIEGRKFYLIRHRERRLSPALAVMIDLLKKSADDNLQHTN